jgi:D-glycero-alpha-D-manno-heptose-7-phosphate kinase
MFWTGHQRDAGSVLSEQKANTGLKMESLLKMRNHAYELQSLTSNGHFDAEKFGQVLNQSWQLKRQLASTISNGLIDQWYEKALSAGAEGGKLCGAGGGGFLLFIVKRKNQQSVRQALSSLTEVPVTHEVHGSHLVLPFAH